MLKIIPLVTAALVTLTVPLIAQDSNQDREIIEAEADGAVIRRVGGEDRIVRIRAKTRHTTVIVLPQTENVLDFVVGDSEYWHLTGAANIAFLKPIAEGVTTNVALVCESGRIYSFLVTEQSAGQPHLVVRIEQQAEDDPRISPGKHEPAFVARGQVAAYQQMAETAMQTAKAAQMDADSRIADAQALAAGESEAFRAEYPTRLKFPYQLEDKAKKWPFMVEGMWHDGQFTYLRSNAQESPALYEEKDGKPALVAYDLEPGRTLYRPSCSRQRLVADRQAESQMALCRAGDRAMIEWRRLYAKPAGSLPGGVVTQYGVGAITVFVLLFLTYWIWFGGGEPAELPGATETEATAPRSFTDRMAAQVEAESLRAETQAAAADRALRAQQQQQTNTARVDAGRVTANEAILLAGPSPDTGQPYTEEEWELRERLRLEAVERRSRSLRSSPIAQTYRRLDGGGGSAAERIVADPVETIKAEGAEALQQALDTIEGVTSGLEDEVAAEAQADQAFIEALRGTPTAAAGRPGRSRRDCGQRHGAGLFFPGADRGAGRPPRLGAHL